MSGAKENTPTANANGPAPSSSAGGGGGGGGGGGKASARNTGKTGSVVATPKASSGPQKRKKEPAPYEPDSKVWTVFVRDNTLREAVVLARDLLHKPEGYSKKTCTVKDPSKFRYYVHYADFNRRMDEWIPFENFREEDGSLPRVVVQEEAPDSGGRSPASDAGGDGDGGGSSSGSSAPATKKGRMSPVGGRAAAAAPTVAPVAAADLQVVKKNDNVGEFIEELTTDAMDEESLKEHDELTKVKNVGELEIGRYRIDTWYFSPYPKEVIPDAFLPTLFLCEFCLDFFSRRDNMLRHTKKCMSGRHPPGDEIYRHEGVAFFEIDGSKARIYCQNLCYLAKLFLDHKTLYYDVDPFMFYVMCEYDSRGYHITGYFSKEKYSEQGYNLACILTLPCYQRRGYGNFLIQFSYALSKKERRMGSPEKPLSDLGQLSYNSYWSSEILNVLKHNYGRSLSIVDIAMATAFDIEDIQHTLNLLGLLKYSHGAHILHVEPSLVERKCKLKPGRKKLDPTKLHWFPIRESMKRDRFSFDTLLAANFD